MSLKLDEFINGIINNPKANSDEVHEESDEILSKDARVEKAIQVYDKFSDIKLKKMYGIWILVLLCVWILFVIVFSSLQLCVKQPVSDKVFITLITASTANIIGLPLIILSYLFPNKK